MKTPVATSNAPAAIGTYSQAIKVSGPVTTVYLSGQIPLDPVSMTLVEGIEAQIKRVFAVCAASGGTMNDIVKLNVFMTDLAHFAKVNEIMATYFTQPYPARAAVGVAGLPRGAQIEMEAVMVLAASNSER
jgi:reactive intermediate/imine deaminase